MQGRYGNDELSKFTLIVALIFLLISVFSGAGIFSWLALAVLIWSLYRSFSKNLSKRQSEREKYLEIKNKVLSKFKLWKNMWRDRNTHRYYTCPTCHAAVRIRKPPKKKRISITCPKCNTQFEKNT